MPSGHRRAEVSVFLLKCIGQIADHPMRWRLSIFCKVPGYPLNFLIDFIRRSCNLFEEAINFVLFCYTFSLTLLVLAYFLLTLYSPPLNLRNYKRYNNKTYSNCSLDNKLLKYNNEN